MSILYIEVSPRGAESWSRRFGEELLARLNAGIRPRRWCAAISPPAIDAAFANAILRRPEEWTAADRDALGYSEQVIGELEAADVVVIATPMNNYTVPARRGGWGGQQEVMSVEDVPEQGGEIAAVADDGRGEFPPQRIARHDPQVATDIGENGAGPGGDGSRPRCPQAWADGRCVVRPRGRCRPRVGRRAAGEGMGRSGWPVWPGSRTGWLISLASSAAARSRPRVMLARICPMSMVPECHVIPLGG